MKRRGLIILAASLLGVCLVPASVSAHVLKTDGDIGAVLHIEPDDNPISGTPTRYVLYFTDTSGRLSPSSCGCKVTIQENGQAIHTASLTLTPELTSQDSFTFPRPDVYNLVISGEPKQVGAFQSFSLTYIVRVTGGSRANQPFPLLLWIGIGSMVGLILLGAYASEYTTKADKGA